MNIYDISEKVFYRFVEFASRLKSYDLSHEDYKLIALGKKEANTRSEKIVKRLSDAFIYLLHCRNQIIDPDLIMISYYLLTGYRMNKDKAYRILEDIYKHNDDFPHIKATKILVFLNTLNIRRKLEFSLLISSYILLKNNYFPLIFYESDKKSLKELIRKRDYEGIYEMVISCEHHTRNTIGMDENKVNKEIKLSEVIGIIKKSEKTIRNNYRVSHLYLYGSYVKGSNHSYSDIDILVIMDEILVNYEKNELCSKLKSFLESELQTKTDVLDFSYSLKHQEIKEMKTAIKIF